MFIKKSKKQKVETPIPHNVTDSIPYQAVYMKGIIEIRPGVYSKSYQLPEVNFKTVSQEKQWSMADQFAEFMGSFPDDATIEITISNKTIDIMKFQEETLIQMRPDNLNGYREEYNEILLEKMTGAKNNLEAIKILTVSIPANDIEGAVQLFNQIDNIVIDGITLITKKPPVTLDTVQRLEILNTIYNQDSATSLERTMMVDGKESQAFSLENCIRQGITTKDVIAPSILSFQNEDFQIGSKFGRSYYVANYPTYLKSSVLNDLASVPNNMLVSTYFNIMPQNEAIKMLKKQNTNIASSLLDRQKQASKGGYDPSLISPDLQNAKDETGALMDDMTKDNMRLFTGTIVITLFADTKKELLEAEKQLKAMETKNLITIRPLSKQQDNGLNSSLPLGNNLVDIQRLWSLETVKSLIPFSVKEVRSPGGIYYGLNAESKNMILVDRTKPGIANPNGCILGMPGAGKSFSCKRELISVLLNTEDEIYVIDPEGIDYAPLANALGGEVITLSAGSNAFVNPFDLNMENHDDNGDPVKVKTDFIQGICEIITGGRFGLSPTEQSIIDRSVREIYEPYIEHLKDRGLSIDPKAAPTMQDFYNNLMMQPYPEAHTLALGLERYVKGGLDIFAHHTNVEINNRFTVYNIRDLGEGLRKLGLQICLDNIWNKMIQNKNQGKRTWIYIDEFYLMMQDKNSASYISQIWKRARKWNGIPTAITQNVEDMLKSEEARTVINNCYFITILGQSPINKQELSRMLNISKEEQRYISSAKPGMGLLRIADDIVPFDDNFPKGKLYSLMTTRPDETKKRT